MTKSEKNKLLTTNTILWLAAILMPAVLYFAFASTRFPWPLMLPFLLLGPMLASNRMIVKATADGADEM